MAMLQKDINFYDGIKDVKIKQTTSPVIVILIGIIVIIAILLTSVGFLMAQANSALLMEIEDVHDFLVNPQNKALADGTLQKQAIAGVYDQYGKISGEAYYNYFTRPLLNSDSFDAVLKATPKGVVTDKFLFTDGGVTMECRSKKETDPATFVNALKKTGIFTSANCPGYTYDDETEYYKFNVICLTKGGDK